MKRKSPHTKDRSKTKHQRVSLVAIVIAASCASAQADDLRVGQWERFELAISNSAAYKNPYQDVQLDVEYTRPDGSKVEFPGFFDGGETWRIRFMPDVEGQWKYAARFSDGQRASSGSFSCVASENPGPLCAYSSNRIWFGVRSGNFFLIRSFHCGDRYFASNWDDPSDENDGNKRSRFLDWAQQNKYNTLSIASHYLNRSISGRGADWQTPKLWPLKASEFQKLELMLEELARRRIYVFPFAGFFGRNSNFPANRSEQEHYLEYCIARFAPYWNLLWNVGGPEPLLRSKPYLSYGDVCRLAKRIDDCDVFDHLLTVHNATGDDVYRSEDWHSFGTLQGPKTLDRKKLANELNRNHHPSRPLYAQETLWPGNVIGHPEYSADDIRKNALVMLFSAAMINYGDMDGNSSSGFTASLDPHEANSTRHDIIRKVWDTFEELPWAETKPRPDLVNSGYCLANPGQTYLVYLADSRTTRVRFERAPYSVVWINPRRPDERVEAGTINEITELRAPSDGDWILMLQSQRQPFAERGGVVAFEAESGGGEWPTFQIPGGEAIRDPGGGRMRYQVTFSKPGKYYVFMRCKQGPRGKDKENDVLVSLNGERLYGEDDKTRPVGMRSYGDWKWAYLPKGPGWHTPDSIRNGPVYFKVPAAGEYTFEIAHRSANFCIDKVMMKRGDPTPPKE